MNKWLADTRPGLSPSIPATSIPLHAFCLCVFFIRCHALLSKLTFYFIIGVDSLLEPDAGFFWFRFYPSYPAD